MVRLLIYTLFSVLSNAVGLLFASLFLDEFSVSGAAFFVAVLVFTISSSLLGPFIANTARKHANFLLGGIALVTTFISLVITSLISDGINIKGVTTWILATLIIWIFSIIANIVLPLFLFKKTLEKHQETKE